MLGAFYWGYILTQVIGGNLSDRFGGDLVQWAAAIVWSFSTLAVVPAVRVSVWLLVLVRLLTGLAQGGSSERGFFSSSLCTYAIIHKLKALGET